MLSVLVVDDDRDFLDLLVDNAKLSGQDKKYEISTFSSPFQAIDYFRENGSDIVVTDVRMDGMDGMKLFQSILELDSTVPVIIMSAYGTVEKAVDAVRLGAHHYFEKPVSTAKFWEKIHEAGIKRSLNLEKFGIVSNRESLEHAVIGQSAERKRIIQYIRKLRDAPTPVLLSGETGTGKKLVGRAIHCSGARRKEPFVTVHCLEYSETQLESALFGHEKGAFPEAVSRRKGILEQIEGGTLYLDEVHEISLNTQIKLVHLLKDGIFKRLGDNFERMVNLRLIAATHKDLLNFVKSGQFRQDLYLRLNTCPLYIPPLRERRDDILPLAIHFLAKYQQKFEKQIDGISFGAMTSLYQYEWPGNVGELENVIESAVLNSDAGDIHVSRFEFYSRETQSIR